MGLRRPPSSSLEPATLRNAKYDGDRGRRARSRSNIAFPLRRLSAVASLRAGTVTNLLSSPSLLISSVVAFFAHPVAAQRGLMRFDEKVAGAGGFIAGILEIEDGLFEGDRGG
jgi:hypothetical protein